MNILNVSDIERELTKLAARAHQPDVKRWVTTVARNHILGRLTEKDLISNFMPYHPDKLSDITMPKPERLPDWAKAVLQRGEEVHWFDPNQLRRRDLWQILDIIIAWFNTWKPGDTRLPRIDRINFDTAAKAAAMWFKDVSDNVWEYVKDIPPKVKEYEHGFHWVRLVTLLHFEREGKLMSHCVGNGGYFDGWRRGVYEFYSLRDKHNKPHCTIQISFEENKLEKRTGKMIQCKGKSNGKPAPHYQPYIRRFVSDMNWPIVGDASNID